MSDTDGNNLEDGQYQDAAATLAKVLDQWAACSNAEQQHLEDDYAQLQQMTQKLATGRVDIVIFGEISTGKSALINALVGQARAQVHVRGGWTREVWQVAWDGCGYIVPGLAQSSVVLIDTPGINEVDGKTRAKIAHEAAQRADLILFVTDSDLNDTEFAALQQIAQSTRPIILVFNKADLYTDEQRAELLATLRDKRLPGVVDSRNIIVTSADPRPIELIIEQSDGSARSEQRKPQPDVEDLKLRILELLGDNGKALLALNAALFAADKSDRIASTKVALRRKAAQRLIWTYAAAKSVAAAINPLPVLDVVGSSLVDAGMVINLARVYDIELSKKNASKLIGAIIQAAGWVTIAELATHVGASLLKGLTFGASTLLTAPLQGAAAGYGSYIVGQAAHYYLEHGASWAGQSPKAVVRSIIEQADKRSIIEQLKQEIRVRLGREAKN